MEVLVADDKLRNEIISDAQAKAARMIKKAERDAESASDNVNDQTVQYEDKLKAEIAKYLSDAQHRIFAAVDIEVRKESVRYVGQIIDEIFNAVRADIESGKFIRYDEFIRRLIAQAADELNCKTCSVLIGDREQHALSADEIKNITPKKCRITSTDVKHNSDGYYILSDDGKKQIFISLPDYMDRLKNEKRMEVYKMLSD